MDCPHAGIGKDAIYMGGNMFTFANDSFTDARIWAFDKAAMYAGAAAAAVEQSLGANEFTPQPLKLHGWNGSWPTGNLHYFLSQTGDYFGDNYRVWSWDHPSPPTAWSIVVFPTSPMQRALRQESRLTYRSSAAVPWRATTSGPSTFEWGAGSLWTAQTISCNPGSGTVNCVRWAEISPANASVLQAGVWAGNGIYLTFPDLAVNDAGDMAIGYTKSSASTYPSVWAAGRAFSDPAGNLNGETLLKAGEIKYLSFEPNSPRRWGDYTGMTVDPDGLKLLVPRRVQQEYRYDPGQVGTGSPRSEWPVATPSSSTASKAAAPAPGAARRDADSSRATRDLRRCGTGRQAKPARKRLGGDYSRCAAITRTFGKKTYPRVQYRNNPAELPSIGQSRR